MRRIGGHTHGVFRTLPPSRAGCGTGRPNQPSGPDRSRPSALTGGRAGSQACRPYRARHSRRGRCQRRCSSRWCRWRCPSGSN
jgi:hypothetical protein